MNMISWLVALSVIILLLIETVAFQKASVCRQEAWLKSFEMKTRALLTEAKSHAREWHLGCRIHLYRNQDQITWQKLPHLKQHKFHLSLNGSL